MSEAYDQKLRRLGLDVADQLGLQIREGVYVMQSGPCYESVTECRLLTLLGADVTGNNNDGDHNSNRSNNDKFCQNEKIIINFVPLMKPLLLNHIIEILIELQE